MKVAYHNPEEAYHILSGATANGGLEKAQWMLADRPGKFGPIKDQQAVFRVGELLRDFEAISSQYSNHITSLTPEQRAAKEKELKGIISRLSALHSKIPRFATAGVRSHEAGIVFDSSACEVLSMARATEKIAGAKGGAEKGKVAVLQAHNKAVSTFLSKMDSEAGQVVSQAIGKGAKSIKIAGEMFSNPGTGGVKMAVHVVKGIVHTAAEQSGYGISISL
jgi:hypothetical protein